MNKFYKIVKNIEYYGNCQVYIANDRRINHNYVTTLYVDENGELAAYWDHVINDKPYFYNDNIGVDKTAGVTEIDEHDISKEDIPLTIRLLA